MTKINHSLSSLALEVLSLQWATLFQDSYKDFPNVFSSWGDKFLVLSYFTILFYHPESFPSMYVFKSLCLSI